MRKWSTLKFIKNDFAQELSKERNLKYVRKYFDISEKEEFTIDNQTWNDLDMDEAYKMLDRCYSSVGEGTLYKMLRTLIKDEDKLKERHKIIEFFKKNSEVRTNIQYIFFMLGRDRKNTFLDMMDSDFLISKTKYYIYTILGKILPILLIILSIFQSPIYLLALLIVGLVNVGINGKEKRNVRERGIVYLRDIINSAKEISKFNNEEISCYVTKIKKLLKEIGPIDKGLLGITIANMCDGIFESLALLFLLEESSYYKISHNLKNKKDTLLELYETIGQLEALISMSSYEAGLNGHYTTPKFTKELCFNIVEGKHVLLINGVPNSINMKKKGLVLTGTNMSGKSTFLRMIGINMILAETFYFALAEKYEASFFYIVSSISPSDDVTNGKSYYMAEAESLLRIINALNEDVPIFCPIDEIFRGTNPVERIAASAEILTYITNNNSISIVTTHDRELVDILNDNYEFYYFSEDVDVKDGLSFDYKLKKGVSKTKNAIKLLDYIGYPKSIIEKAYRRAEKIDGFI
ncbi:MutS-related protein [Clostridium tarantellae]|uniref:DNA mismatch repair protein MutS n=1 Tax=Clostridium tarantellae TaxID=39493 RepID=A0A6I1MPF6_9CLOT|nr:DNA mismatch repair protein MutS [Clostridium tarantellae]MPQ44954.1 DNA mismatch repair protein MutS [Clostridium tarantellae]